ncbi:RES family NAD+ phosphorylase [Paraburkholderia sp. HP33-1]|uniref:RES family NAD+ phosphorylase n=1 Tax=Paraburkholderia sp. HP33-1 TaxID=2883243 RepID=UPI001F23698D|nr:RES family NAD+ phosphorylase [Paraburkholderia sp. HP33-1]
MTGGATLWRIGTDTPAYTADDLSGVGAKITGGRWNRSGTPMLYTAGTIALACLETLVHLKVGDLPLNRYLISIAVPPTVWRKTRTLVDPAKHVGWDALPAGMVSLELGEEWVRSKASVLAVVPSVIVPRELNVLVNPEHPDIAKLKVIKHEKWSYDHRLMKRG